MESGDKLIEAVNTLLQERDAQSRDAPKNDAEKMQVLRARLHRGKHYLPRRFIKSMENTHKQVVFETVLLGDSLTPGADGTLEPSAEYTLFIARAPIDNPGDVRMMDYFEERQLKTGQVIVTASWLANSASPAIRRLMNIALLKE